MAAFEKEYLEEFAYLGDNAYFNCCSFAMQPKRVLDFCRGFQQEFVDSFGNICLGPYGERREQVKDTLAALIGASPDEIVLTQNTTEGDCLLMHACSFAAGDSVVLSNYDYPSLIYGWYRLQERGIRVRQVAATDGMLRAEDFIAAMDETTRVVAISQVQYLSGYQADLKAIGDACHKRGILFVVDGIQALGRNAVDVKDCHISVYSCGGFKGLLGVLGAAFYYCDAALAEKLSVQVFSENNVDVDEYAVPAMDKIGVLPLRQGAERFAGGSLNTYGILAMGLGAGLLREIGIDRIHAHVVMLEEHLRAQVQERRLPVHFLGSTEERFWSGTPCLLFAEEKAGVLEETLEKRKIQAAVRRIRGDGHLRVSFHYYNTIEQVDRLVSALAEVL